VDPSQEAGESERTPPSKHASVGAGRETLTTG